MSYTRCTYSGGACSFPDDDEPCEHCEGYVSVNCLKCKKHKSNKLDGIACSVSGKAIIAYGKVCSDLDPNCLFCEHHKREWRAGFPEYSCKLGKQRPGDFNANKTCSQLKLNKEYLDWRQNHPSPAQ